MRTILLAFMVLTFINLDSAVAGYLLPETDPQPSYLLAQAESDDSYDPFSDYSEFDEASDEEADVHFFRNGRFFTVGLAAGMRAFTGQLNTLYSSGATYGVFLSYFFDLRLALQFGFNTGDYSFQLATPGEATLPGNVSMTFIHANLKYYFNTQNVTKGLADLNPYLLGGFSQVYRTVTVQGVDGFGKDAAVGIDVGLGIEIPLMRRKAFFGIQGTYHYVNFKDESSPMLNPVSGTPSGITPKGDTYDVLGIIGMNF